MLALKAKLSVRLSKIKVAPRLSNSSLLYIKIIGGIFYAYS